MPTRRKGGAKAWSQANAEALFTKYARSKDPKTRDDLVMIHHNLVRFLAGKFVNRGEPLEDLIQVGTIGLINAIDRFDPERGIQFSTYATPTIVGEIRRYFRDKAWSLKVPRRLQELNMSANKASEKLNQTLGRPPSLQEIAHHIGSTEEETMEAMELGNAYDTISLDSKLSGDDDSNSLNLGEFIGGADTGVENMEKYGDLNHALEYLDEREKSIIKLRFFKDLSQAEVANKMKISQMHVSRLQQKALSRLRDMLSD